jgi:uncharacterized protein YyaL (SSP411 family)
VGTQGEADFDALVRETASRYLPSLVLAAGVGGATSSTESVPLLRGRGLINGRAAAYVCRGNVCDAPVSDARALGEQLERAATRRAG